MEALLKTLEDRIHALETKVTRQERAIRKLRKDMIPEEERKPRKPSGFAKPTYLSPELCIFLNVEKGTELARTEVTKRILQYVKDNNLQNETSKRIINVDAKLKTLLQPSEDEQVTYFSIQRLMKPHYVLPENATTTTPNVEVVVETKSPATVAKPVARGRAKKTA